MRLLKDKRVDMLGLEWDSNGCWRRSWDMFEIIFEITEDEVDGGYSASDLGYGIHTEGDSLEELRANLREAVDCYFEETVGRPKLLRLHFVRDEALTV